MATTDYNVHSVRFPSDVYTKLRKLAELERRAINSEVIVAVEKFIAEYEVEHGPIPVESVETNQ